MPTIRPIKQSELVLGLVYGAGTEAGPVERLLREQLQPYAYTLRSIHLSEYFPTVLARTGFTRETPNATRELQDMGDEIREKAVDKGALAQLAVYLMAAMRTQWSTERTAWLIRSLRRPEEVQELRRLYGPRFVLLGIHAPEVVRQRAAEERRQRWSTVTSQRYDVEATADIRRDEEDPTVPHGQSVRDTFAEADFFVDARSDAQLKQSLPRTIRLIFGEPFEPPTRDEQAMYHTFTAGLRSSEMGRQVGAAIVTQAGDLVAVGTNDVPSGRGGLYWSPDQPNGRDYAQQPPLDSNTLWQRRISRELLVRMARSGLLSPEWTIGVGDGDFDITEDQLDQFLAHTKGTRFRGLSEFGRAVHAEMDAITTAARIGQRIGGCTLVTTTWPCHNCTRHVISSGLSRVVYIRPYSKSLARDLHKDAVVIEPEARGPVTNKVVFEQFIGVAPRGYPQYFDFAQIDRRERPRRGDGVAKARDRPAPRPRERHQLHLRGADAAGHPGFSS